MCYHSSQWCLICKIKITWDFNLLRCTLKYQRSSAPALFWQLRMTNVKTRFTNHINLPHKTVDGRRSRKEEEEEEEGRGGSRRRRLLCSPLLSSHLLGSWKLPSQKMTFHPCQAYQGTNWSMDYEPKRSESTWHEGQSGAHLIYSQHLMMRV